MTSCGNSPKRRCAATLRSRSAAPGTGKDGRRRGRRCTPTGGGFKGIAGSGYWRCEVNGFERNFAHQFDTGDLDRLLVRGLANVHKKLLIQAAARNLALLMRAMFGAGKPKAAHDSPIQVIAWL